MNLPELTQRDFMGWLGATYNGEWKNPGKIPLGHSILDWFNTLPFCMQSGVYWEYFRGAGIEVTILPPSTTLKLFACGVSVWKDGATGDYNYLQFSSKPLDREQAAFTTAAELREKQLTKE